ncbi:hypothetical protein Tco_0243109 [Tanacetum coccineum]
MMGETDSSSLSQVIEFATMTGQFTLFTQEAIAWGFHSAERNVRSRFVGVCIRNDVAASVEMSQVSKTHRNNGGLKGTSSDVHRTSPSCRLTKPMVWSQGVEEPPHIDGTTQLQTSVKASIL